jgi:hypothetical protein
MSLLQQPHVLACRHHHSLYLQCEMSRNGLIHECDKPMYRQVECLFDGFVIEAELVLCGLKMATWFGRE